MELGINSFRKNSLVLFIIAMGFLLNACDEDIDQSFIAEFSYEFITENQVQFTNQSKGEYYSLSWDFGNGETESTIEKSKTYQVYYNDKGDYTVTLIVLDYGGTVKTATQVVSIQNTDLSVSFTIEEDGSDSNNIQVKNTTVGGFDSFKWIYRNREIVDEMNPLIYFPFAGSFDIELQVIKGDNTYSRKEAVVIMHDDPDYLNNFTLVWSDEFDGPEIDNQNWTFETGSNGWGNNELQKYTNGDNVSIEDGILKITTEKLDNNTTVGSYTSTRINTLGKQEFTYGRMEIRANLPEGRGIWPAIWMLGTNLNPIGWPACGEIDILEYVGYEPNTIHSTVHTTSGSGVDGNGSSRTLNTAEEDFHIYGVLWTEKELVFYVDELNNVTHTYAPVSKNDENWPFDQPQFFILNVAVGGNWGGALGVDNSIFPQTMEVDYVRVFQSEK